jgi:large subunit ribosomal protein L29
MKAAKWRDLSEDEIRQKLQELGEEIFNLRFQLSMGVAKNPSRVRQARRDLARAKTILAEKARPGAVTPPAVRPTETPPRPRRAAGVRRPATRGRTGRGGRSRAAASRTTTRSRTTRKRG